MPARDPAVGLSMTVTLGDNLTVGRLGFGGMRITGRGIWGCQPAR
jgi:pyridoxine 4-dehydrogenase